MHGGLNIRAWWSIIFQYNFIFLLIGVYKYLDISLEPTGRSLEIFQNTGWLFDHIARVLHLFIEHSTSPKLHPSDYGPTESLAQEYRVTIGTDRQTTVVPGP